MAASSVPGWHRACIAFVLATVTAAAAAQPVASADEVKAAYIHKFVSYIDWPSRVFPNPSTPIVVGVVGAESVSTELARVVASRTVQGRTVAVRTLSPGTALPNDIQVLFVGRDAWVDMPAWVAAAKGRPVAVVTDAPRGVELGALLTFVESNNRLRFEASLPAAEQAGVRLSSRLLAVAERVVGATP